MESEDMEIAKILGEKRERGGRHANERLRKRGMLPAVVYGHGETPETVALSKHDLELALAHTQHVIALAIDGQEERYLIKEVQYDHLQKDPVHVDLMRVRADERVEVQVAVELKGTPKGVTEGGGSVNQVLTQISVECPLLEIPAALTLRVNELDINDSLAIKDIELPAGVKALDDPDDAVVVVQPPREEEEPTEAAEGEAAEGAEPEVIAKGGGEEEDGEA
jgi:large subunit ribosomal protein L25